MFLGAFELHMPTRILFGPGKIKELGSEVIKHGKKALLLTGNSSLRKYNILEKITQNLKDVGVRFIECDGISGDPTVEVVDSIAAEAKREQCELVIGIGGGSVMDTAKMVAVMSRQGQSCWEYINTPERSAKSITPDVLPIIAVPTTAGTASESTPFAVVTNTSIPLKKGMCSHYIFPKLSIIDPEIHVHIPPEYTAWTGMDGFGQALESWISANSNQATDMIAKEALIRIHKGLIRAYDNGYDIGARSEVAWGACLSGIAIAQNDTNLAHAMSFPLGARYGLHHGMCVATTTPISMEFNMKVSLGKYLEVSKALGVYNPKSSVQDNGQILMEYVSSLLGKLNIPNSFKTLKVPKSDINILSEETLQINSIKTNVREVQRDDLINLFSRVI